MSAPRTDFYTSFHKGLRKWLFDAVVAAGSTDWGDSDAGHALWLRLEALFTMLDAHAEVEERYLHPFYAEHMPTVLARLQADHHHHGDVAHALRAQAAHLHNAKAAASPEEGLGFYRRLARFVGDYLAHLDDEEASLPMLWEKVDEPTLARTFGEFQRSRTPEQLSLSWELMLPGLTPRERAGLARAVKAAPAPVYAAFRKSAAAVLDPTALAALDAAAA